MFSCRVLGRVLVLSVAAAGLELDGLQEVLHFRVCS